MTTFDSIDRLADAIAELVVARASKSTVTRWAAMPDFPKPIRPPTDGRGLGHPLFLPAEVRKWALGHREGATGRVGRQRKETA